MADPTTEERLAAIREKTRRLIKRMARFVLVFTAFQYLDVIRHGPNFMLHDLWDGTMAGIAAVIGWDGPAAAEAAAKAGEGE